MQERTQRTTSPRVLLISANREHFPFPVFPLGLALVGSRLSRGGSTVKFFDAGLRLSPLASLKKELKEFHPDTVGISLRNIDNASYPCTRSYLPNYSQIVNAVRSSTDAPIILGGSAFSLFPEELLNYLQADAGCIGDGEACIDLFCGEMDRGIHVGRLEELSEVEFSDEIGGIFPNFQRYRLLGIQTARGCPHNCIYCTYPLLEGRRVRKRPPERIADEIEYLARRHKIRGFFIVDSSFNADERHMVSVLESIISKELDIRFMCYLEPKFSFPSLFRLLAKAGCVGVDFGTDSGADTMLHSMRKGFSVDDVISASRACREAGINFTHSLIFGGPGETSVTIEATANLMDELGPNAVIAMTGIRIYPRTEIERIARSEGVLSAGRSLLDPAFYSAGNQPMWLFQQVSREASERKGWFLPGSRNYSIALGPYGPIMLRLIYMLKLYNVIFRP